MMMRMMMMMMMIPLQKFQVCARTKKVQLICHCVATGNNSHKSSLTEVLANGGVALKT